jgi:hypothetical protein
MKLIKKDECLYFPLESLLISKEHTQKIARAIENKSNVCRLRHIDQPDFVTRKHVLIEGDSIQFYEVVIIDGELTTKYAECKKVDFFSLLD